MYDTVMYDTYTEYKVRQTPTTEEKAKGEK